MEIQSKLELPGATIIFEVVQHPSAIVGDGFERKFGSPPPADAWPHHICALWVSDAGVCTCIGYVHFGRFGDTCVVGGMFTDGRVIRRLPAASRDWLRENNGLAVHMLRFGFARFANDFDAFFGLVENPRALEVDLAAGFVQTRHERLVMHLPKPLDEQHIRCLQAKVLELGDF